MGRRWVGVLLGVPAGLLLSGAAVFVLGMAAPEVFPISQAEGAWAMQVAFFFTPLGGLVGAIAGLVWALRSRAR